MCPLVRALVVAALVAGCDSGTTEVVTPKGDPNAMVQLDITSSPSGLSWVANVGDDQSTTTINGATPFSQQFTAPEGFSATARKTSSGGTLTVCLTNLQTGEQRCGSTSVDGGQVALTIAN